MADSRRSNSLNLWTPVSVGTGQTREREMMGQLDVAAIVAATVCLEGLWGLAGQPHAPGIAFSLALLAAGACALAYAPLLRRNPARAAKASTSEG